MTPCFPSVFNSAIPNETVTMISARMNGVNHALVIVDAAEVQGGEVRQNIRLSTEGFQW